MAYQGGKALLASRLAPIILGLSKGRRLVEPFHGGLGMTAAIRPALASDLSRPMNTLVVAMRDGWDPPKVVTETDYAEALRRRDEIEDPWICFVGQWCTWGGKWFGGYARSSPKNPDFVGAARAGLLKRIEATRKTAFRLCSYADVEVRAGDVFYCDPPYADTTQDYPTPPFDSAAFWDWCARTARAGADVLVSEFSAPEGTPVVWERDRAASTRYADRRRPVERLFHVEPHQQELKAKTMGKRGPKPSTDQAARSYPSRRKAKADKAAEEAARLALLLQPLDRMAADAPGMLQDQKYAPALAVWRKMAPELRRTHRLPPEAEFLFMSFCIYAQEWVAGTEDIHSNGSTQLIRTVAGGRAMERRRPVEFSRQIAFGNITELSGKYGLTPGDMYTLFRGQAVAAQTSPDLFGGARDGGTGALAAETNAGDPEGEGADASLVGSLGRMRTPPPGDQVH